MMRIKVVALYVGLFILIAGSSTAFAQVDNPALTQSVGWAIVRTIAALLFILGLFFVLVYLLKRYYPKAFGGTVLPSEKGDGIDILTVRPLGGKRFLYLVRVDGRRILIGMTEQQMQALSVWEEADEIDSSSDA